MDGQVISLVGSSYTLYYEAVTLKQVMEVHREKTKGLKFIETVLCLVLSFLTQVKHFRHVLFLVTFTSLLHSFTQWP